MIACVYVTMFTGRLTAGEYCFEKRHSVVESCMWTLFYPSLHPSHHLNPIPAPFSLLLSHHRVCGSVRRVPKIVNLLLVKTRMFYGYICNSVSCPITRLTLKDQKTRSENTEVILWW